LEVNEPVINGLPQFIIETIPTKGSENFLDFARVRPLHMQWEAGRKVEDVSGIAFWLRVRVAQGDPACLFWSTEDGKKKIVAVTGYRGGYKNFEGEMQISEIGADGKMIKTWVKSSEVLQKGKSLRDCGGDSFYIIYPKKSLVAESAPSEGTLKY
jgi:hypothetical protein